MKRSRIKKLRRIIEDNNYPQRFKREKRSDYNCYGYAIGITEWLELGDIANLQVDWLNINPELLCVAFEADMSILKIKIVKKLQREEEDTKLKPNQWEVALYWADEDFHFIRKDLDGTWSHKQGESSTERHMEWSVPPYQISGNYYYVCSYILEK